MVLRMHCLPNVDTDGDRHDQPVSIFLDYDLYAHRVIVKCNVRLILTEIEIMSIDVDRRAIVILISKMKSV